ncbi:MAG: magnesium transporter, partial [Alphaproteobacteria bacterium]|nr:magnesium transporter [Alphaproteobacteria bacterium]
EALAAHAARLDTDDAAYVLEDLEVAERKKVLDAMPPGDRELVAEALSYPEASAGRLMQRDYVAVPQYWTIGQVIDWLRESGDLPDDFYEIFVVDPTHSPVGTVPLNRAMRTKRPVPVAEIMATDQKLIPVAMDQEEVAFLFDHYNLMSAAVVDPDGRMIGQITIDDVVDVIQEEHEEDLHRLGGVSAEGDIHRSAGETTRARFAWLLVNLFTAALASVTIALFADTIAQIVALAILMPIVASMGGNAGTQTLTVAVRALATRELTAANAARIFWKETIVGGYNGLGFALLAGILAWAWFGEPMLAVVIGLAMVVNLVVAGMSGILIPLAMWRAGIDPAVSAAVLLTTVTDVVGFFAFLGLAKWILL